jgi:hypothetical protein
MLKHTVFFKLKHPVGSLAEADFLRSALTLAKIPGVKNLSCVKQVSPKNDFTHGLVMSFEDDKAFHAYNAHPDHIRFVTERWHPEVAKFMEIDYTPCALSSTGR